MIGISRVSYFTLEPKYSRVEVCYAVDHLDKKRPRRLGQFRRPWGTRLARSGPQQAREAATAVFRARHPEFERRAASDAAARIIAWAAREHSAWFWRGVGLPPRR